jgi:putative membrane protein
MKKTILGICVVALFNTVTGQEVSKKDIKFVKEAANGGLLEVKLGELALSRGRSESVRTLGQHMVNDHRKANEELTILATKKKIDLPKDLDEKSKKCYDKLAKKEGEAFDKAYTKLMVKDHKKDVGEFKKESEKGDDPELKTWTANTLPTLQHHLDMSKEACDNLKKK